MNPEDIQDWLELENDLYRFYQLLDRLLLLGQVCPVLPWVFGYKRKYKSFSRAFQAMERSRNWFFVWIGLISFAIAKAETEELARMEYPGLRILGWYDAALKYGCSAAWLDGLTSSCIYAFDGSVRRTGIFLHPDSEKEDQPSVEWFHEYSIPIWFPYDLTIGKNPKFSKGLPSATQLQALQVSHGPSADVPTYSWISFFEARTTQIGERMRLATKMDLDMWEARKKQNRVQIVQDASVFEWKESASGEWVREKLSRRLAEWALLDYRSSQVKYCPYFNEYDCCEFFFGAGGEDREESSYFDSDYPSLQSPNDECIFSGNADEENRIDYDEEEFSYSLESIHAENEELNLAHPLKSFNTSHRTRKEDSALADSLKSSPLHIHLQLANPDMKDRIVAEILSVLRLYFGFTGALPNPRPTTEMELSAQRTADFLTVLGFKWQQRWHDAICSVPSIQVAEDFICKLSSGHGLSPQDLENWDISEIHRESISLSKRFKCIHRLVLSKEKTLFLFDFGQVATVPWKLAVKNASTALLICRLEDKMDELEILRLLLQNGIPFHTFAPTKSLSRTRKVTPTVLPLRREDHIFTVADYDAFQTRLSDFLMNSRRARAALMRGGHSWRVSVRFVDFGEVESGPTGWCSDRSEMLIVNDPVTGEELMDDVLTPPEEELVSGSYRCLMGASGHRFKCSYQLLKIYCTHLGQGEQVAFKSWFPDPGVFARSGLDYGRWTELSERLYRQIVEKTGNNTDRSDMPIEQPKSSRTWRKALHGKGFMRRALHALDHRSDVLLRENGK